MAVKQEDKEKMVAQAAQNFAMELVRIEDIYVSLNAFPHVSAAVTGGSKHLCRITFKVPCENYKVEALEI
jgi:hypothetical protein